MNSLRKSRFLARRSRKANMPARSRVSLADFRRRRRPPTNPSTFLNSRFFARLRAQPFFARMVGDSRSDRGRVGSCSVGMARGLDQTGAAVGATAARRRRRRARLAGHRGELLGLDHRRLGRLPLLDGPADAMRLGRDRQERLLAEPADLLAALVAVQVRRPAALVADLAGGRHLEPLLHSLVGLQLGHRDPTFRRGTQNRPSRRV